MSESVVFRQDLFLGSGSSGDLIESFCGDGTNGEATTTMEAVPLHRLQLQQVEPVHLREQVRAFD